MNPGMRVAGIAGMIAGVLLVFETSGFLLSGWSAAKFADPVQAIELLRQGGVALRWAALFGFAGLGVTTYFIVGLAAALHDPAPALATGVLYFGLIGIAGHSLVPLGLWIGTPAFLTMAAQNLSLAQSGWAAFGPVSDTAHGVSNLFLGCSMLFAGIAMVKTRMLSSILGWIGIATGALTLATLALVGTPISSVGAMLLMPALVLTVLFRFWAGLTLWRKLP